MAETIKELRALSTEELIRRHDNHATHTVVGTGHYLEEIARRDADEQTKAMLRLTRVMTVLTVVITILTVINVVLVAVTLK